MITNLLKRALPFALTLIVGTGLGSIFGFNSAPKPKKTPCNAASLRSVYRSGTGGGEYRHRRSFDNSTPLDIHPAPQALYTPEALRNKTIGVVTLLVRFNADGTTTVLKRLSTLPDGLTEEAVRVAERTRFTPATANGEPVSVTREMNYPFTLDDHTTR
ncbi:MAG: energy transducer TonB [Pyrinomonadaceae bacterium]|nr:energy transducer TonB [Pyrinomonadaceae bacterium]